MTVIFSDGTQMRCLGVHGAPVTFQGVTRDCLTFLFPPETDFQALLDTFTPENCARVTLSDGSGDPEGMSVHEHYEIRTGAGIGLKDALLADKIENLDGVCWVSMVQSTMQERTLLAQQEVLDALTAQSLEGGAADV